jgi:hypothetical protein
VVDGGENPPAVMTGIICRCFAIRHSFYLSTMTTMRSRRHGRRVALACDELLKTFVTVAASL